MIKFFFHIDFMCASVINTIWTSKHVWLVLQILEESFIGSNLILLVAKKVWVKF